MLKKKIGMIHGVFDVIHFGHILYFKEAKKKVDKLIVSVTADEYVNKGPEKPIFSLKTRMEVLKSIKYIDDVVESNYPTAVENIKKFKPNFYIKGKDYKKTADDLSKNIIIEKKEVEKYGGKIIFTESELYSSSSIINKNFDYINSDAREFINSLNKKIFLEKLNNLFLNKSDKRILVIGDPIKDIIVFVRALGKSNKNNVISTQFLKEEVTDGGVLLVIKFLQFFFKKIDYLYLGDTEGYNYLKKVFKNKSVNIIHIKSDNSIIEKKRFTDKYSSNKLFQINKNESDKISSQSIEIFSKYLLKNQKKYKNIINFDYGYALNNNLTLKTINSTNKKLITNCQSNSFNFGYNMPNKYKGGLVISMDENEFRLMAQDKETHIKKLLTLKKKYFKKFKYGIVTQGKNGCHIIEHGKKIYYSPSVFKHSVDSTGSGDLFLTTFFIGIFNNFSIQETSFLSHIVAGLHGLSDGNKNIINKNNFFQTAQSLLK
jgi:rfaE bifunctional protein nucleotidyltransferase chain/domain